MTTAQHDDTGRELERLIDTVVSRAGDDRSSAAHRHWLSAHALRLPTALRMSRGT